MNSKAGEKQRAVTTGPSSTPAQEGLPRAGSSGLWPDVFWVFPWQPVANLSASLHMKDTLVSRLSLLALFWAFSTCHVCLVQMSPELEPSKVPENHCWHSRLNQRPLDLQSNSLPAELFQHCLSFNIYKTWWNVITFQLYSAKLCRRQLKSQSDFRERNRDRLGSKEMVQPAVWTQGPCHGPLPLFTESVCEPLVIGWWVMSRREAGKQNFCSWRRCTSTFRTEKVSVTSQREIKIQS